MSNAFKFFTIRKPEILTKGQIDDSGIKTHLNENQSKWYAEVSKIADTKDKAELRASAKTYLEDKQSIHSLNELTIPRDIPLWVQDNFRKGVFKHKEALEELLKATKAYEPNERLTSNIKIDLARVADTMVALSLTNQLSTSSIDYVKTFKSIKVVEYLARPKRDKPSVLAIKDILEAPVYMPSFTGSQFYEVSAGIHDFLDMIDNLKLPNCDCADQPAVQPNKKCVSTLAYMADLMVLQDDLVGYEGADLAYVETVMLGEKRKREHRHLERTDTLTENETTSSRSEEKDHQVNDRFSLQTEAEKTIQSDLSVDAGVTAKVWGPGYDVTATANGTYQSSKADSSRVAKEKSVEITDRSVLKIQKTVRELSSKKKILETEEINTHKFENLPSDREQRHVNGMYQFINARYKNQVINYDRRMMIDIVIPRPMKIHMQMMSQQAAPHGFTPASPPDIEISEISDQPASDGESTYYLSLAKTYGVAQLPEPPPSKKHLSFDITCNEAIEHTGSDQSGGDASGAKQIKLGEVPLGYIATQVDIKLGHHGTLHEEAGIDSSTHFYVGKHHVTGSQGISVSSGETIYGSLLYHATSAVAGAGYVTCDRLAATYEAWQLEVYEKIMDKHNSDLQTYNAQVASWEAKQAQKTKFGKSVFENRMEEEKQLKRQVISYLTCQFYDQFTAMKDKVLPCDRPQMDFELAKKEGNYIAFFEQIIDWPLIMYIFYAEFWAGWCHEEESKSISTGDILHDKALTASAARVQVPVKKGKEALFDHYLQTGETWFGNNELPTPEDDYYISMAQEIKELSNFNSDRPGDLSVTEESNTVTLTFPENEIEYWNAQTTSEDELAIKTDLNREIMIEGATYRIVAITQEAADLSHRTWTIQLDRPYTGDTLNHVLWSTGGVHVGSPFFTTIPQNLVYLRNMKDDEGNYVTSDCLPSYPQPPCE